MARPWHASLRPDAPSTGDSETGEVRVPLELWTVDRSQGHCDLVLSRAEAKALQACLTLLTTRGVPPPLRAEAFG
ncbi:hypothetical protein [Streptomyces purpureus]|uniref:Uncharacterized protein n=1 Tax=Streptomyces purpureus TaxID=1951 RepID=A0A918LU09_9ACTN|nr:hypothetical protein [Streptomyces purpureus]GGT53334.1 hypothetical protein GCM10014713_53940 [Streptomyces purpureus]